MGSSKPPACCLPAVPQVSAGGLVSALMGVGNFQTKWIGWPGAWGAAKHVLFCVCLPSSWRARGAAGRSVGQCSAQLL